MQIPPPEGDLVGEVGDAVDDRHAPHSSGSDHRENRLVERRRQFRTGRSSGVALGLRARTLLPMIRSNSGLQRPSGI
jgi:hypothetical protein